MVTGAYEPDDLRPVSPSSGSRSAAGGLPRRLIDHGRDHFGAANDPSVGAPDRTGQVRTWPCTSAQWLVRDDPSGVETDDAVGLADRGAANPYDLGGSRRRLLALACVLAMRTPVVVLDEPTMGLDSVEIERVAGIVAALAAEGRTVVAISHDARFVAASLKRVIRLDAGRVVTDKPLG